MLTHLIYKYISDRRFDIHGVALFVHVVVSGLNLTVTCEAI